MRPDDALANSSRTQITAKASPIELDTTNAAPVAVDRTFIHAPFVPSHPLTSYSAYPPGNSYYPYYPHTPYYTTPLPPTGHSYNYHQIYPYYNSSLSAYSSTAMSAALNPTPPTTSSFPSSAAPSGENHNSPNELAPAAAPETITFTGVRGRDRPA